MNRRALVALFVCLSAAALVKCARAPRAGDAARGLALMRDFRDSLPSHSGNDLRCVSCHLDNGRRGSAMSWAGTYNRYPRYRARPGVEESLVQRVNQCITRSLAGRELDPAGADMRDMMAYLQSLRELPREGPVDSVKLAGDVRAGVPAYAAQCARCHGATGQGTAEAPAVWGAGSFSIGAGMGRQYTFATFIRHNMPFDHAGALSDQMAADIAAYVLTQPRQEHPGKELDWPNGDPPPDVSYPTDAAGRAGRVPPPIRPLLPRKVR